MNLELWYRTFIDGDGVQTLSGAAAGAESVAHAESAAADISRPAA